MRYRFDQCPLLWLFMAAVLLVVGCRNREAPTAVVPTERPSQTEEVNTVATPPVDRRRSRAIEAKDALFSRLSGRLTEVMQSEGPAAAIEVCSREAVEIARSVGKEHGVEIGRTSFKLRNQANAPRDWVQPLVEQRVETQEFHDLDDGTLGALFPIRVDVKCLLCHGGPDDILEAVKPELEARYPNDAATGFSQGDLRGWFWVEVPPRDGQTADEQTQ